jgi:CheY-like chemotaxis protein
MMKAKTVYPRTRNGAARWKIGTWPWFDNHFLSEASTGQGGITEAAQRPPDVVLLDLGLPDIDGISVLKRLRE